MSEEEKQNQKYDEEKEQEEEEKGYKINVKKKVDDTYKESVAREKSQDKPKEESQETFKEESKQQEKQDEQVLPEVNFPIFVSSLGMQAMMNLGEIENPITKKKEVNLEQSKYFIDILEMLKEKTKGNLNPNEEKMIEELEYQLKIKYVEKKK